MKRTSCAVLTFMVVSIVPAKNLHSQTTTAKPARFGIMGGATFPLPSNELDVTRRGWNAGALIAIGAPTSPLSFRLDGQWHELAGKTASQPDRGSQRTNLRIIDGTADVEYAFGKPSTTNFYVIGGVGLYNLRGRNFTTPGNAPDGRDSTFTLSANKFGLNAGVGVRARLTRYTVFIESRFHSVSNGHIVDASGSSNSIYFLPIDIGITL